MFTRRSFFKYSGATMLTLYATSATGTRIALAQIPGGSLAPGDIPKWETPVLIPPVMPRTRTIPRKGGFNIDYYEIAVRQFQQLMLPASMGLLTPVWGYGPAGRGGQRLTTQHHAPSYTIEALAGYPTRVRWVNDLVDDDGAPLPHLLPVDPTLHWANPGQVANSAGRERTDQRPDFSGKEYVPLEDFTDPDTQYTRYTGPVPLVTHMHGAMGVGDESDGYTEAWVLPDATGIDAYAPHGRWYEFFAAKAEKKYGVRWAPGEHVTQYANHNRPSTLWFHDHALGMTRANVYAGPAGFYLLRDQRGWDGDIRDARTGERAFLPGPAPRASDPPQGRRYYEIPLAVQDRSFDTDGTLFYPDTRRFFSPDLPEDFEWIPGSDLSPIWNPEFFGNTLIVNGKVWPYLDVEQRRYRLRFLNGCQSRFLVLDFSGIPGIEVWQVGNEGGLLEATLDVSGGLGGQVLLGPAERADLVVDFTNVALGNHVLRNLGPDEPFGGPPFEPADPDTTGQVMQFRVGPLVDMDPSTPGRYLVLPLVEKLPAEDRVRRVALIEAMSEYADEEPAEALLGVVEGDPGSEAGGHAYPRMWDDEVSENPATGDCEVWEIYNTTGDAHPIHVHEVAFEVLGRQPVSVEESEDPEAIGLIRTTGQARAAEPWETGRKDTVIAYPEEVTRLKARFTTAGQYVWHCHILEHEDNEMMRPLRIGPAQEGQPTD